MMKIVLGLVGAIILVAGAFALLKGSGPGASSQAQSDSYATTTLPTSSNGAPGTAETFPAGGSAPTQAITSTTNPSKPMPTAQVTSATLHTSMGDITVAFYPDQAPKTVANFLKLASSGFYDGTKFHRVIKGFMDQGGDPLTKDDSMMVKWGQGGPGYTIPDEFGIKYTNVAGALAMANTGAPDSGGSQFFINAIDNHFLDGKYTVFGHVTAGMDVVTKINNTPVDSSDRPTTPVVLTSITLK